ncbi:hypothetical protein AA0473_0369 [Acetobacter orleanensis NRIC 0473]|nr:hypothetical protein AA0473_0369 [Acetobacter orleanensis NRIC 0473]
MKYNKKIAYEINKNILPKCLFFLFCSGYSLDKNIINYNVFIILCVLQFLYVYVYTQGK